MATLIAWNNESDLGTASASSAALGWPASNVQQRWPSMSWKSTGITSEWLKIDLGATYTAPTCAIIYNPNFTISATVYIQANATDSWGSPSVNQLVTSQLNFIAYVFSGAQNYRYWRITVADTTNTNGYVSIGRLFIGTYFQFTHGFQTRKTTHVDRSKKSYSVGGQVSVFSLPKFSQPTYSFPFVSGTEKSTLISIFNTLGQAVPYFIVENGSDLTGNVWYCQNYGSPEFNYNAAEKTFESMNLTVEQLI